MRDDATFVEILRELVGEKADAVARAFGPDDLRDATAAALRERAKLTAREAERLEASVALGRYMAPGSRETLTKFGTSRDVYDAYRPRLAHLTHEVFLALALDARNRVIGEVEIAHGSLTDCPVHPREAFRAVLRYPAAGVIWMHNHPSSDPTPSRDDVVLTERLRACADLLGIRFIDHIVIGSAGYYSFCDGGMKSVPAPVALRA